MFFRTASNKQGPPASVAAQRWYRADPMKRKFGTAIDCSAYGNPLYREQEIRLRALVVLQAWARGLLLRYRMPMIKRSGYFGQLRI